MTEIYDDGFRLDATGDFEGRGIWTFVQDGPDVLVDYDWKILAEKPILRDLSFIMKPIFGANHRWAMARGEESLKLELARRHAGSDAERGLVPASPPATKMPAPAWPMAGLVVGLLAAAAVIWLVRRRD